MFNLNKKHAFPVLCLLNNVNREIKNQENNINNNFHKRWCILLYKSIPLNMKSLPNLLKSIFYAATCQ